MKFFEDLMDATSKLADQAVKAGKEAFDQGKVIAGEAVDKGKKKMNQLALENDMKDAYRKLGELVYMLNKTGETNEELVKQYIDEIAAIEADLELLTSDIVEEAVNEEADFTVTEPGEEPVKEDIIDEVVEEVKEAFEEVKDIFTETEKVCPSLV